MNEISCGICQKSFQQRTANHRFCSKQCYRVHHIRTWGEQMAEASRIRFGKLKTERESVLYACTHCGTPYSRRRGTKRFCSVKCRNNWHYNNDSEKRSLRSKASYDKYADKRKARQRQARLETPWRVLLSSAKVRSHKKRIGYNLTAEWAEKRWNGNCELSGIPFVLGKRGYGPHPYSPSIDRRDSSGGYTQDNCRFVLWAVNALKHIGTENEMYQLAEALVRHIPRHHRP